MSEDWDKALAHESRAMSMRIQLVQALKRLDSGIVEDLQLSAECIQGMKATIEKEILSGNASVELPELLTLCEAQLTMFEILVRMFRDSGLVV